MLNACFGTYVVSYFYLLTGFAYNPPKYGKIHAVKSNILFSTKIGTYGNKNSHFRPNIICRYLTYVYDSTYCFGLFFNHRDYNNLGITPEKQQRTEA